MDGPSSSKQGKRKRTSATKKLCKERRLLKQEEKRLRWIEPPKDFVVSVPKRDPRPKRTGAVVNFDGYLTKKKFRPHEVKEIGEQCPGLISVKEDVCPIPIRLAPLDYPRQWFLHNDHYGPLKEYIVNRTIQARLLSGPDGPLIQQVLKVDGYALVLGRDDFTVQFVRELIPVLINEGMPVKEPTEAEMKLFNATRNERCDINILVKYRKHGRKRRQRAAAARRDRQVMGHEPEDPQETYHEYGQEYQQETDEYEQDAYEYEQETNEYQQIQGPKQDECFDPDFNLD